MKFLSADKRNFISKLSIKKLLNIFKLKTSFCFSRLQRRVFHAGLPTSISIEPTTACNLHCPECPSGLKQFSRPVGNIDRITYKKIIDELHPYLTYLLLYFQGEPFLHSQFFQMIDYAVEKKIYTATSTNGHFLTKSNVKQLIESKLDRLIISIDGTTQKTYSSYRVGGNLVQVINGVKTLVEQKKKTKSNLPYIILQFLVMRPNQHQIADIEALAKELKVDELQLKSAQIYDFENGNELMPDIEKYSRYKKTKSGKYTLKNPLGNYCRRLWQTSVITWDGDIVPCCFDKNADFIMGNILKTTFSKTWQGTEYSQFRNKIFSERSKIAMCRNCTDGLKLY